MQSYAEEIWRNVPFGRNEVVLTDSRGVRIGRTPDIVELRRWGRTYRPFEFQSEIIEGLLGALEGGPVVGLIALPTGSGKTRTAAWTCLRAMSEYHGKECIAVWLAPQKELVDQAAEAMQAAWWSGQGPDSLDVRVVRRSQDLALGARPTCLCLTPSMARAVMHAVTKRAVGVVVFDEAHHAAAAMFSRVWKTLRVRARPRLAIGLSATPSRRDPRENQLMRDAFDGIVYCSATLGFQPVRKLIARGVLSAPRFRLIPDVPDFARHRGPEDLRVLKELVSDPDRWRAVIECLLKRESGQTVLYALDRVHGRAITHHLRSLGVEAEYLDGKTPNPLRFGILERFRNRETRVLVNVALLLEGVDCPAAEALVLTYPVRHAERLKQMVGRVLRGPAVGGTDECRVWALEGSQERLDESLFGTRFRYSGWKVRTLGRSNS